MQVLYQEWKTSNGAWICSISKDAVQLEQTVKELKAAAKATPDSKPFMVEVPDTSGFVDMVQVETLFLHDDERDILTFPE